MAMFVESRVQYWEDNVQLLLSYFIRWPNVIPQRWSLGLPAR